MKLIYKAGILVLPLLTLTSQADEAPEQSMDAPWEANLDTPYDNDESEKGKLLKKRWLECGAMVFRANAAAETVAIVINNPDDYRVNDEQNRDQIRQQFPTDNGNFRDQINERIQEYAFEHWELANTDGNQSPKLSKMAWDWCTGHSPEKFSDL